jgi:hypothetical protein
VEGIGGNLDAGADLSELRGLLQHDRTKPFAGQRERGRKTTEPASRGAVPGLVGIGGGVISGLI